MPLLSPLKNAINAGAKKIKKQVKTLGKKRAVTQRSEWFTGSAYGRSCRAQHPCEPPIQREVEGRGINLLKTANIVYVHIECFLDDSRKVQSSAVFGAA